MSSQHRIRKAKPRFRRSSGKRNTPKRNHPSTAIPRNARGSVRRSFRMCRQAHPVLAVKNKSGMADLSDPPSSGSTCFSENSLHLDFQSDLTPLKPGCPIRAFSLTPGLLQSLRMRLRLCRYDTGRGRTADMSGKSYRPGPCTPATCMGHRGRNPVSPVGLASFPVLCYSYSGLVPACLTALGSVPWEATSAAPGRQSGLRRFSAGDFCALSVLCRTSMRNPPPACRSGIPGIDPRSGETVQTPCGFRPAARRDLAPPGYSL